MRLKKQCLLIFFILNTISIKAQEVFFRHFTVNDGIPSSSVYDIAEDQFGYLWLATETGVCRFNGLKFETFNLADGIPAFAFLKIARSPDQNLVFISREGMVYLYNYKYFRQHPQNQKISQILDNEIVDNLVCETNTIFFLTTTKGSIIKITPDNVEKVNSGSGASNVLFFVLKNDQYLWGKKTDKKLNLRDEQNISHPKDTFYFRLTYKFEELLHKKLTIINRKREELMISVGNRFYHIGEYRNYIHYFENPINDIIYDKLGNIWISTLKNGCFFYREGRLNDFPEQFFKNKNILKIFQDKENNFWLISEDEGLYYIPSVDFRVYSNVSFHIISLDTSGNKLYFVTEDERLFLAEKNGNTIKNVREIILQDKPTDWFEDLYCYSDGSLWILRSRINNLQESNPEKQVNLIATQYVIREDTKTGRLQANVIRVVRFKDPQKRMFFNFGNFRGKPFYLFVDLNGTIWVRTIDGVISESGTKIRFYKIESINFSNEATDYEFSKGITWIGTRTEGIKIINSTGLIVTIRTLPGLISNFIRNIYLDQDTVLWIGTNNGIYHINSVFFNTLDFSFRSIRRLDGIPYREINELLRDHKLMWVATTQGLMSFMPEEIHSSIPHPAIKLKFVRINYRDTVLHQYYKLGHRQNTIYLEYEAISFREPVIYFKYRMAGLDDTWNFSRSNNISFSKLPPGTYNFEVYASYSPDEKPENSLKITFVIKKPVYQQAWFIVLMILIFLAALSGAFFLIISLVKKSSERQKNHLLAEISALRSQMNPHFLFNSLNIIQDFITNENYKDSLICLSDLSKLLRMILEASRSNLIYLSTELKIIELFINIIRIRYVHDFSCNIKFEGISPSDPLTVPPMIIQPFIENAVFHGLKMKEGEKNLLIVFSKADEKYMKVIVEDNGIGREKSQELKKFSNSTHKSMATYNIFDRIRLINQLQDDKIKCQIIDLNNDDGSPSGTRVELMLPLNIVKNETGQKY